MGRDAFNKLERITWIDIAKGIGLILVVIGHCNPPALIRDTLASFHMPLFFFISGLTYKRKPSRDSFVKDVKHLVLPYCITVGMVALFSLIIWYRGGNGYYTSWNELMKAAIFGSGSGYKGIKLIGEIWFLLAMFWTRRVMDFVCCFENKTIQALIVISCVIVSVLLSSKSIWIYTNIDIALVAVLFLYVGWLVQEDGRYSALDTPAIIVFMIMIAFITRSTYVMGLGDRNYSNFWWITLPGAIAMLAPGDFSHFGPG